MFLALKGFFIFLKSVFMIFQWIYVGFLMDFVWVSNGFLWFSKKNLAPRGLNIWCFSELCFFSLLPFAGLLRGYGLNFSGFLDVSWYFLRTLMTYHDFLW